MLNLKSSMSFLFALSLAQGAFAMDCPKKLKVEASGFSSISDTDEKKVESISKLGDRQTNKDYIRAVLKVAGTMSAVSEVLKLSPKYSSDNYCSYHGKTASLRVVAVENQWAGKGYTAILTMGKINYEAGAQGGNPSSHKGFAVDVVTHLTKFSNKEIAKNKTALNVLEFGLLIQIPLGDYGTDGFEETAKIGKAKTVNYTIAE